MKTPELLPINWKEKERNGQERKDYRKGKHEEKKAYTRLRGELSYI